MLKTLISESPSSHAVYFLIFLNAKYDGNLTNWHIMMDNKLEITINIFYIRKIQLQLVLSWWPASQYAYLYVEGPNTGIFLHNMAWWIKPLDTLLPSIRLIKANRVEFNYFA